MCLDLIKSNIFKSKSSGTNIPLQKEIPSMPEVSTSEVSQKQYSSLLKPYTNFDNIKDMDIDRMAEQLAVFKLDGICDFCKENDIKIDDNELKKILLKTTKQFKKLLNEQADKEE